MPRLSWLLPLSAMILIASLPVKAAPLVTIQTGWPSYYGPDRETCGGFSEDALTVTVSDHGKKLAEDPFCSSYGRATASVIRDKAGEVFVLLEYSEGRGNGQAVTNYLKILEFDRSHSPVLLEVLRVPLSWATSFSQRFTYSYNVELPASGGIRVHLKGQNAGPPSPLLKDRCCIPDADNLTIDISR